ncbi:glycosyltransferase [Alphaproteobacteria bacterium]|nr:glycosyltransferase [Alphaproteobacteria bacterium]
MKKLFIYLPTYNRPNAVRTQLRALAPQVVKHQSKVRVLVNDNASDSFLFDEIINEFSQYENIKFHRNAGNIGANGNTVVGFILSQPDEFLWLLSDNDIIKDTAVDYILQSLDERVDFYCFVDSIKEPVEVDHSWESGWQTPMEWRMGLTSDALYNVNTVQSSIEDGFYYHNASFPHLAIACSAAKKKGIVKFKLLPRDKINKTFFPSDECPTIYSLAQVCMPLLVSLFPPREAKSFSLTWLSKHGLDMYRNRKQHYHLYLQSRATLLHYGGLATRFMLFWMWMVYLVASPIIDIRQRCIAIAKQRLSPKAIEKLKSLRSVIWGK